MTSLNESPSPAAIHHKWTERAPTSAPKAKPAAKPKQPGPPSAVLPEDQTAADLAALFDQYRRDATFRAALVALGDRILSDHGEATDAIAQARGWESAVRDLHRDGCFTTALADFAAAWKLDLLPVVGDELAGQQALQSWLMPLFLGWTDGERPTDLHVEGFGGGIFAGVEVPHLWEVDEAGRVQSHLPRTEASMILTYDPTWNSWAEVEARLLVEARAHRGAIEADHRDAGYPFPDVAHRRQQHAAWCYRRLVHKMTYPALAEAANKLLLGDDEVSDSRVRVAVKAFAERAGINITKSKPKI